MFLKRLAANVVDDEFEFPISGQLVSSPQQVIKNFWKPTRTALAGVEDVRCTLMVLRGF